MAKSKVVIEESVRVGAKHQVTIPRRISKALNLKKGDHMLVRLVDNSVEMVPAQVVPKDQRWFWSPEWQAGEREVNRALARGEFLEAKSADELLRKLKS